jgi:thymidylate kinase
MVKDSGIERGHRNEGGPNWERARRAHLKLAERYGWEVVDANQTPERVHQDILKLIFKP